MNETPILVLSGPVGVGKTTVGEEVSEVLDREGVAHTLIDFDQLRYTYPRIPEDPWCNGLAFQNLASIWENCKRRGSRNLVISTVVEDEAFIDQLSSTISESVVFVFQLYASPATLMARVNKREIGSGLERHRHRAMELLEILARDSVPCDARIDTDNTSITDTASEIVRQVNWST